MSSIARPRISLADRLRSTWTRLLTLDDTPHRIALGVLIGTIVAYQPIVGIQMIVGALVCKLIGANVIASLPLAWITNPFTIVPVYYATYKLGVVFTGGDLTYADMKALWATIGEMGLVDGVIEGTKMLLDIMWPMVVGGAIVGVVNGAAFYFIVRRLVTGYQARSIVKSRGTAPAPAPVDSAPVDPVEAAPVDDEVKPS